MEKVGTDKITLRDYTELAVKSDETLASWHCKINMWEWPPELRDEPDDRNAPYDINGRRTQMMHVIEQRVGRRAISWEWNRERMTLEDFNDFYAGQYEGDKAAGKRHAKRSMARIKKEIAEGKR